MEQLPQDNYKLSEIRFKQDKDYMDLSAIQLVFANGVESPLFESLGSRDETLKVTTIDTSREITTVRMKLYYGIYYTGLELIDESGDAIVEDHWFDIDSSND